MTDSGAESSRDATGWWHQFSYLDCDSSLILPLEKDGNCTNMEIGVAANGKRGSCIMFNRCFSYDDEKDKG